MGPAEQAAIDEVQAEIDAMGESIAETARIEQGVNTIIKVCSKCTTGYAATSEFFHADSHSVDGFQSHCKACRNAAANLANAKEESDHQAALDKELIDNIEQGFMDPRARHGLVPASEIYECLINDFGGPAGLSRHLAATYIASASGGAIREKILRMIVQMGLKLETEGISESDTRKMTDAELEEKLQNQLAIVRGNRNE